MVFPPAAFPPPRVDLYTSALRKVLPGTVLRAVYFTLAIFMMMSGDRVDAMDSDSSRDGN